MNYWLGWIAIFATLGTLLWIVDAVQRKKVLNRVVKPLMVAATLVVALGVTYAVGWALGWVN